MSTPWDGERPSMADRARTLGAFATIVLFVIPWWYGMWCLAGKIL